MKYQDLLNEIFAIQDYGLELFTIGYSLQGRSIYATHIGKYDNPQVIIQCGIHAREWITSFLGVELAKLYSTKEYQKGGFYIIFNSNPDGIALLLDGIESVRCDATKNFVLYLNGDNYDFSDYKANINGVDLNTNFDALWGTGSQNVRCPSIGNFIGYYPDSERETKALINFTFKNKPTMTISYHSKGEVIFYGFDTQTPAQIERDRIIGQKFSDSTGYPLIQTSNSSGGYKDWCIEKFNIPSYTIEVGNVNLPHPIELEQLPTILMQNKEVPQIALDISIEMLQNI